MAHQNGPLDAQGGGKFQGEIHIAVHVPGDGRLLTAAEAGKIGGDHPAVAGKMIGEQAVGFHRGGPAMEKQKGRPFALIEILHLPPVDCEVHAGPSLKNS